MRFACLLVAGFLLPPASVPNQAATGAQEPARNLSRTVQVEPGIRIVVEGDDGLVRVVGGGRGTATIEVSVVARGADPVSRDRLLEAAEIGVTREGEVVVLRIAVPEQITGNIPRGAGGFPVATLETSWTVTIPVQNIIEVHTGRGRTELQGTGAARLESTSGDLTARDLRGDLAAGSVSGNILVDGCNGNTDVNTVSGDITIERAAGVVRATCISGNILIRETLSGNVRVSNTGGSITYEGAVQTGGTYTLGSHSGNILFITDGDVGFSAQLSTFSGSIFTPLDFTLTGSRTSRRSLAGYLGGSEASVTLTAYSGDLTIRRR
ncbi:DUF4097 domain-containing protein [Gemmatimonadota bacterium]